jgi:hypothetical protein
VLGGGFAAAAGYMVDHHSNRDGREGLSYDDIQGVYSGVRSVAPLRVALEADHPKEIEGAKALEAAPKKVLLEWLDSGKLSQQYDNLDLGMNAPAEILAVNCVNCHARSSGYKKAAAIPLEYWDDVERLSISREISPMDGSILLATTHTHALALATTALLLVLLLAQTRFHGGWTGLIGFVAALGLAIDISGWWLARESAAFVPMILGGGALFGIGSALMMLTIFADVWLPRRSGR